MEGVFYYVWYLAYLPLTRAAGGGVRSRSCAACLRRYALRFMLAGLLFVGEEPSAWR